VTLAAHTELGGSLPASVINMLSTAAPLKMMATLASLVQNEKNLHISRSLSSPNLPISLQHSLMLNIPPSYIEKQSSFKEAEITTESDTSSIDSPGKVSNLDSSILESPVGFRSTSEKEGTRRRSNSNLENDSEDRVFNLPLILSVSEKIPSVKKKIAKRRDSIIPFVLEGKQICEIGIRLLKVYLGLEGQYDLSLVKKRSGSKEECETPLNIDWQSKGNKKGVSVESSMVSGSNWQAVRAVTGMRADKHSIVKLIMNDNRMGEFDDMFDFATLLVRIDDCASIRRLCFKPIWPTAPRDFLCCTTWTELEDGSLLVMSRSASEDVLAPQKGYVRGKIQVSGYLVQPYSSLQKSDRLYSSTSLGCKVTLAAHTELGGSLPASVINMLSTAAPLKMMANLRTLVE
jgi:hypothetical protein